MNLTGNVIRVFARFFMLFMFLSASFNVLLAQDSTGRVVGVVYDPSGAVVQGVHVVVTNAATRVARETTTDSNGFYQVLALPIGSYTVSAKHQGFSPITTTANALDINQSLKMDIHLKVGSNNQTVTVETSAPTIETINPTMGSTVSDRSIENLPLNGRNALDLAVLQPGVMPADNPGNAGAASSTLGFSVSGGRNDSNTFILDGGANNDLLNNGVVFNPNPDTIQEFRVLTSNFTAEYGRNGGGVVTVVTKSGGNAFHGSGFEYNRNTAYNANDFFNNVQGLPRGVLKRNQYGGTLGGPIKKGKLFFFVSYEGQRENQLVTSGQETVFTPSELTGNFSASPNQAAVAAFLQANPFFQGNPALAAQGIIDPTKIDPVSQKFIQLGLIPTNPLGKSSFQNPALNNPQELTAKLDFDASAKNHFTATLGRTQDPQLTPGVNGTPGFSDSNSNHRQFLNFAFNRIVTPTMLNEFRVTFQRNDILQASPATALPGPSGLGIATTPDNPTGPPLLTFPGFAAGFSPQGPSKLIDNTFTYADTFSWTKGKHTMKYGASFSAFQDNQVFDFFVNGNFDFAQSLDGVNAFGAGDAFANFLIGLPDFYFQAPAAPSNIRTKATYFFGQDEWHVKSNLVLTYGLRYEFSTPKSDTQGRTFSVVPGAQSTVFPNAPLGVLFPGDKRAPTGSNFPVTNNFAPRLGFAWQPFNDQKTSIRGGFGVFYDILKAEDNFQFNGQFPFASTAFIGGGAGPGSFNSPTGAAGSLGFLPNPFGSTGNTNPFPSKPVDHNVNFANTIGTFGGAGVFFVDPNLRSPYVYQYNLNIERELARKTTFEAAYVGSSSHGLTGLKDINPFDPATLASANPQRVLNEAAGPGALGFLPQFMNVANANYNALQLSLRQQASDVPLIGKVYYTAGYTWAHSIDDASGFRNNNSQVPFFQPHIFRASSDFDLRQFLTFSGGWDLPFNRGPQKLVKGWSFYPIVTWRTGYPFTVGAGLNTQNGIPGPSGAGDAGLVNANQIAPIHYLNPNATQTKGGATGQFFFDPASFSDTPTGPYGTAARNLLRGPGRSNMDLTLAKTTPIFGERFKTEFRVDAFNIFNHTQFRNLDTNAADIGAFGEATSTYDPRILQLAVRVNF